LSSLAFYGARKGRRIASLPAPSGRAETLADANFAAALAQHGLTVPKSGVAASPDEAARIATEIGFPVVVKIVSRLVSHKTEIGGVRLSLNSPEEVARATQALARSIAAAAPAASIDGFLVQEMVEGIEVLLGARTDPLYGPMIV